jgi:hypothetical protein
VAQRIEHLTTDQKVGGSSPSKRTETREDFTTSWVSYFYCYLALDQEAEMKLEKLTDTSVKPNFVGDVSQDVSQLHSTVIHRLERDTGSAGGSVNLQRVVFSQRLKNARDTANDPGRSLPGIGYFQANALAAEKIRPAGAFICAFVSEVFKGLSAELYCQVSKGSYQSGASEVSGNSGLGK